MFVISGIILSVIIICFSLYIVLYKRKWGPILHLKGPTALPVIGNALDFWGVKEDVLDLLFGYTNKFGRIYKIHDGPWGINVVVSDAELTKFLLSSAKMTEKVKQYSAFHSWLGDGLFTSSGTKWRTRRKMLTPSFHFSVLENFIDVFDKVGDVFIQKLDHEVGKSSLDIYPLVTLCTLDIIHETAMGTSVNTLETGSSEYTKAVKTICSIIHDRLFSSPDARFQSLLKDYFIERRTLKILHDHTDAVINQRKKSTAIKNKNNDENDSNGTKNRVAFLDLLLTYTINAEPLSLSDIREEVDTFMFGGHDTLASALSFTLYALANNPQVQEKAYKELETIYDDMKNAKTTDSHLSNMKYLELVIKESLRLYPAVPMIARTPKEDFEWDGVIYPKDVDIGIFIFALHRDSEYFPDPEKFDPERWTNNNGTIPYTYVPFSAGPRNCIGQKFAMLEMKSVISKVLRNFELLPAVPEHMLHLTTEVMLLSKNGLHISLKRRT